MRRIDLKFQFPENLSEKVCQTATEILNLHESYPKRLVCSKYFDTRQLTSFHESEEGIVPRKKFRIRWYGERDVSPDSLVACEIKTTCAYHREKITTFRGVGSDVRYREIFQEYGILEPVVITRYERRYFENSELRVTVDSNLAGEGLGFLPNRQTSLNYNVLEVKVPETFQPEDLEVKLGMQTSRSSKYCDILKKLDC